MKQARKPIKQSRHSIRPIRHGRQPSKQSLRHNGHICHRHPIRHGRKSSKQGRKPSHYCAGLSHRLEKHPSNYGFVNGMRDRQMGKHGFVTGIYRSRRTMIAVLNLVVLFLRRYFCCRLHWQNSRARARASARNKRTAHADAPPPCPTHARCTAVPIMCDR